MAVDSLPLTVVLNRNPIIFMAGMEINSEVNPAWVMEYNAACVRIPEPAIFKNSSIALVTYRERLW